MAMKTSPFWAECGPWGIAVEDVRLTDCAPTRVYRLFS